ncbi:RagB/SusD family nutrient uptake outer membrane protein [Dyadobacter sp. CY312]|uniref:RagB/SusD family nutrient uptake outer membrane protein n=1 Tax=Dyadobacter sp. CY312 TaxID=2907303 RepID=UPI001F26A5C4|nr:RagB/SusD family nutrient uptake outer membrane protein [Dyadobacter sp. CY312]MCE7042596.1 RagB/SusD family nutrient uptake outer membrane protein [Dyadobacter sp. CY312]
MKMSKNIKIMTALVAGLFLYSCQDSFLDKPALGSLSDAQLSTKAGVENLLIGAYAALDGNGVGAASAWDANADNWIYGSIAGGDAHKGSDGSDQAGINAIMTYSAGPSNGFFNSKWKAVYEGINRANTVLKFAPLATNMTDAQRADIMAQARFLRGHYYSEVKKMYNNVPWIDETTTDPAAQTNTTDIWPQIEADFKFAMDNLPATQAEVGRANKWAAASYLAKTLVYQKKFAEAKTLFDQIISQGVTSNGLKYALSEKYEDNFDGATKNNSESIFAVQAAANDGTNTIDNANAGSMLNHPYGSSPFGCCGFYQPSQDLVNSFRTDPATGLPFVDNYNATMVKNDMNILSTAPFTPDVTSLDPRLDWTVGRRGLPYHDWGNHPGQAWIRLQSYAGPYAPKKHIYWQATQDKYSDRHSWAPGSAINILIIRYADVLLLAAEAEAQAGTLAKAQEYVNMVRARAANPKGWLYKYKNDAKPLEGFSTTPAANYKVAVYAPGAFAALGKDKALKTIYFERRLELGMEGHRFFDLSRWGISEETLNAYIQYESKITSDITGGKFVKGKNEYYPIPQSQIDLSTRGGVSSLKQNPNYQ